MFRLTYAVEKKLFFLNFLFFILTAVFPVASLWVLKILVDRIVEVKDLADRSVLLWLGLFMVIQILQALVQQWATYFQQVQQNYLQRDISLRVMKKAGEIRFGYYSLGYSPAPAALQRPDGFSATDFRPPAVCPGEKHRAPSAQGL
jgi:ABC-type multidrug transport system fused ATPase/permease subunit